MNYKSAFERELKLKVHSPVILKFTRGSWETEGVVKFNDGLENIYLDSKEQDRFEFEILQWIDK
jgi:hypothetical protein